MITLESNTATCVECWARGDKRASESHPCGIFTIEEAESNDIPGSLFDTDTKSYSSFEVDEVYFDAAESQLGISSRPTTPTLYAEIHSALCPVSVDNDFDLSRVCDSVKLADMRIDYRARRSLARSIKRALWEEDSDVYSFVSCLEHMDELVLDHGTSDEEDLDEAIRNGSVENMPSDEPLSSEGSDPRINAGQENAYYSILGSFVRDITEIERMENDSLEYYGKPRGYYEA